MESLQQWVKENQQDGNTATNTQPVTQQPVKTPRLALEASADTTSQDYVNANRLASTLGYPVGWVMADPQRAQKEETARKIEQNDKLSQWVAEETKNATFAREDTDSIFKVFDLLGEQENGDAIIPDNTIEISDAEKSRSVDAFLNTGNAIMHGIASGEYGPAVVDIAGKVMPGFVKSAAKIVGRFPGTMATMSYDIAGFGLGFIDNMEALTANGLKAIGVSNGERTQFFGQLRDTVQQLSRNIQDGYLKSETLSLPKELQGRLIEHPEYLLNPEYLVFQTGEAINSIGSMILGAMATGGGSTGAVLIGSLAEAGAFFNQLMEDGVSQEKALSAATVFGAVVAGLEKLGFDSMFGKDGLRSFMQGLGRWVRGEAAPKAAASATTAATVGGIKNTIMGAAKSVGGFVAGGAGEGITEYFENPVQALTESIAKGHSLAETIDNVLEALKDIDVIPGALFAGGAMNAISRRARRNREAAVQATERMATQQEIHAAVEQLQAKQLDPSMVESMLRAAGMGNNMQMSAQDVLTLYQEGTDIITPMGWDVESVQQEAEVGGTMEAPLSRMHAWMDQQTFDKAMEIATEQPDGMNAATAANIEEISAMDEAQVRERAQAIQQEEDATNAEIDRLANEFTEAVQGNADYQAQLQQAGTTGSEYFKAQMAVIRQFMGYNVAHTTDGRTLSGELAKVRISGVRRNEQGQLVPTFATGPVTPEESFTSDLKDIAREEEERASQSPSAVAQRAFETKAREKQATARQATPARPVNAKIENGRLSGRDATIYNPDDTEDAAHYEIREMGDIIPSHDPVNGFAKREDYPAIAQERNYHSSQAEQDKVRLHASGLKPWQIVNNSPTLSEGPSVITKDGIVLGGNSRAMTMQLVYANHLDKAQAYRDALAKDADIYGIDPKALAKFKQPVLVRVLENDYTPEEMAVKSRLYNRGNTQAVQDEALAVSLARLISDDTLARLSDDLADFESLREYFKSTKSRAIVDRLEMDGIIEKTQRNVLVDEKTGLLSDKGKDLFESALRGLVITDADVLTNAPASVLNKVDKAIPALARLKAKGNGWDMSPVLLQAMRVIIDSQAKGTNVATAVGQSGLIGGGSMAAEAKPAVQAMAITLENATAKEVGVRFTAMMEDSARGLDAGMEGLVPMETPAKSFIRSFLQPIVSVGNTPISGFNPAQNPQHAAIEFASKSTSVKAAREKLEKTMADKKAKKDAKVQARETLANLTNFDGKVEIFQPKLGNFFSYREGQTLFQLIGARGAEALDKAEEATTRLNNLVVAREMEENGKSDKEIKLATGWERGADGYWRYEIMDGVFSNEAKLKVATLNKKLKDVEKRFEEIQAQSASIIRNYPDDSPEYKAYRKSYDQASNEMKKLKSAIAMQKAMDAAQKGEAFSTDVILENLLNSPDLYSAYPFLKRINITFEVSPSSSYRGWTTKGEFGQWKIGINFASIEDIEAARSTLLHEIQHLIQEKEGFAKGANVQYYADKIDSASAQFAIEDAQAKVNDQVNAVTDSLMSMAFADKVDPMSDEGMQRAKVRADVYNALKDSESGSNLEDIAKSAGLPDSAVWFGAKELYKTLQEYKAGLDRVQENYNPVRLYRRTAGEVEARNVQARMGMTAAQRRKTLASETEDVSRADQIFIEDSLQAGVQASMDMERAARMQAERMGLGPAYDFVLKNPTAGPAEKVIASIGVGDIEEAFDVHLGPAIERNGIIVVQGKKLQAALGTKGHGLVKVVWGHGEGGNKYPHMPIVTKKDVLSLPQIVREYAPVEKTQSRITWRIPREDGNLLIIGTSATTEDTQGYLVTMYVGSPGLGKGRLAVSEKRKSTASGLSKDRSNRSEDTDGAIHPFVPRSQQGGLARDSMAENRNAVNRNPMAVLQDLADTVGVEMPNGNETLYQIAYHGTPYHFDKFTLDHIGEGEGAQAHGWGLYFAQDRDVAESYRETLGDTEYFLDGKKLEGDEAWAASFLFDWEGKRCSIDEAIENLESKFVASARRDAIAKNIREFAKHEITTRDGQLYQVDIPENDVLLDEQKTFDEQPEKVKQALREMFGVTGKTGVEIGRELNAQVKEEGSLDIKAGYHELARAIVSEREHAGRRIYEAISKLLGSDKLASLELNNAGIKGITYDGRRDGRCFVVFDDKAISILETMYQAMEASDSLANPMENARGAMSTLEDGSRMIQLFRKADLSTLAHESWHVFFESMDQAVRQGVADQQMQDDYATLCKAVGAKPGDQLTRDQKEQLARWGEGYLAEGKSPSRELRPALYRFASWLAKIYRDIKQYVGMEMTPEVRDVFDRILATEAEIEDAYEGMSLDLPTDSELNALGVRGKRRAALLSDIKAAKEEAASRLDSARRAGWDEREQRFKKEAIEQIQKERPFAARRAAKDAKLDYDYVRDNFGAEYAASLNRKMPGSFKSGGMDPEQFARDNGYENAREMFTEFLNTPKFKDRFAEVMAEKRDAHDQQFVAEQFAMETDAMADVQEKYGLAIARIIAREEYQQEVNGTTRERRAASKQHLRDVAEFRFRYMAMKDAMRPNHFRRLVAKWAQEERRALLKGDFEKALDANFKCRLNMEMARMSAELVAQITSVQRKVKRFTDMKKGENDARYLVYHLATKYGLVRLDKAMENLASVRDANTIKEWYAKIQEDGYSFMPDDNVLFGEGDFANFANYMDMDVDRLRRLVGEILPVITIERDRRKVETANGKRELAELAAEMSASILEKNDRRDTRTVEEDSKALQLLKKFHVNQLKADTIARLMDDDQMGIVWQHIIRPINKATYAEIEEYKKASEALQQLFNQHYDRKELIRIRKGRVFIESIGESLSKENMLCVLLNYGNESNLERLKNGHGWSDAQIQDILSRLEKKDFDFAQRVWDYLNTYQKQSFDQEEELTGVRPTAIKGRPFTAFGQTYAGGYYPVKYNNAKVARADELKALGQATGAVVPVVQHGSMKERAGNGLGPLLLSLDVVTDHISETVHNITFRKPVREVMKVLKQKAVADAMQQTAGMEQYKALTQWVTDLAGQHPAKISVDKVMGWARTSMSMYTMGLKATTMVVQATGFLSTANEIGTKWMAAGIAHVYGKRMPGKGWVDLYKETAELSPMMANRLANFDREAKEWARKNLEDGALTPGLDQLVRLNNKLKRNAFMPMAIIQMGVDLPTWWGAYQKKMAETGDNDAAIEFADNVVEIAQVGGNAKDLSALQRSEGVARLFTMFYSYFGALYNIFTRRVVMAKRHKDAANIFNLAQAAVLFWMVEPVLSELLAGRGPDDDDGEEWPEWLAQQWAKAPFQMIVGVRDVVNAIVDGAAGESRGYRISPVVTLADEMVKLGINSYKAAKGDKDVDAKFVKQAGRFAGMLSGTPLMGAQMQTTLGNFYDWLSGTSEFEIRDAIFAKPKSRRN